MMPRGGYGVLAHHNSHDTPATVDPKSLRDLMVMNAAYAYFLAAAGPPEKRWMAEVALNRGYNQLAAASGKLLDQIAMAETAEQLGRLLYESGERMNYALDRESQSVRSAWDLKEGLADLATFAGQQKARLARAVRDRGTALGAGADSRDRAREKRGGGTHRGSPEAHGHDHSRRPAAGQARGLPGGRILGRARVRALLVRRQEEPRRGDPPHDARNGTAEFRFRRLFQIPREARIRRVRTTDAIAPIDKRSGWSYSHC